MDDTDTPIGLHTFDPTNNQLDGQTEGAQDNKNRFLVYCKSHKLKIMNTQFQKHPTKTYTYEEMGIKGPPYERHRCEMIDYILIDEQGKNIIKTHTQTQSIM